MRILERTFIQSLTMTYGGTFLAAIVVFVIASKLSPEAFASVGLGMSIGAILTPLLNLSVDRIYPREARQRSGMYAVLDLSQLTYRARWVISILVWLSSGAIGLAWVPPNIENWSVVFLFAIWTSSAGLQSSTYFDYIHHTRTHSLLLFVERLLSFALVIILVKLIDGRFAMVTGGALVVVRLTFVAMQYHIYKEIATRKMRSVPSLSEQGSAIERIRELFSIVSVQVTIALLANGLIAFGGQIYLADHGLLEDVSSYALAMRIANLITMFQGLIIRHAIHSILDISKPATPVIGLVKIGGAISLLSGAGAVAVAFIMPLILILLGSGKYDLLPSIWVPLAMWLPVVGFGQVISQVLVARGRYGFYMAMTIFSSLLAMGLGYVVAPSYGGVGVAYVLLIVHSIAICVQTVFVIFDRRWE